jgi:hypothetical protein
VIARQASKAVPQLSRRAMAAAVALAVPAAWISPAGALIDYDEDDECDPTLLSQPPPSLHITRHSFVQHRQEPGFLPPSPRAPHLVEHTRALDARLNPT